MLSEDRIRELFVEYLPPGIVFVVQPLEEFVNSAKQHPYIQLQMQIGIYTEDNIAADFLSPARAFPTLGIQMICVPIFNALLEGIPTDVAENFVRHVAAHEAHHFHDKHTPVSAAEHSDAELACSRQILLDHPELGDAVAYVETNSPVYRRVFARMADVQRNLITKGKVTS